MRTKEWAYLYLYHKRNPFIIKTESEINSNKKKRRISSRSKRKLIHILILVQNNHESMETIYEIFQKFKIFPKNILGVSREKNIFKMQWTWFLT